ncbi:MAG: Uma2 family endonuclease [Symploca sp. SIO2E6]|nr:Uma2 family endonuclease [Symploca sp. SIO2E6]
MTPQQLLTQQPENLEQVSDPDISHLVIEDDTPVDNFQSEQQQRLLVEPLYTSLVLPRPFLAAANVGLFYELKEDPIVPDVMLSLGVKKEPGNYSVPQHRSYFAWKQGKLPEVCIEIVSNKEGDELFVSKQSQRKGKTQNKLDIYEAIGIPYYVVFDPLRHIQGPNGMDGALLRVWKISDQGYQELTSNQQITSGGEWVWLEEVGIGLMLWYGEFEEDEKTFWLRWCDQEGQPIPTGAEGNEIRDQQTQIERQRAERERQRADTQQQQLQIERQQTQMERQRAEMERQRADTQEQRAERERQRAEMERQRADTREQQLQIERQQAEQLKQRLREMGIDPDQM